MVITTEVWINKAKSIHGNKYDYSQSVYTGARNKIDIICPVHGKFSQKAEHHYHHECKKCSIITGSSKLLISDKNSKEIPEYSAWLHIKQRCYNVNSNAYKNYGGRGITMCDRWLESSKNFLEDMGPKPGPSYSIDRIDNDGNYEPGNCRWATNSEQVINQRPRLSKSGIKNITIVGNRYIVYISRNNKLNYGGSYKTKEEAVIAREKLIKIIENEKI